MKIRNKPGMAIGSLSLILIVMFLFSWWTTKNQQTDGLAINLLARQSMLTQKMSKDILLFQIQREHTGQDNETLAEGLRNTMKVFDTTLSTLKDSGMAPLSLDLEKTEFKNCPKAEEPAYSQLETVSRMWEIFSSNLEAILKGNDGVQANLDWITENNLSLLKEINKAGGMLQKKSEARVIKLLGIQFAEIIFAICCMTLAMLTIYRLSKRLERSKDVSLLPSSVDLKFKSGLNVKDELSAIGVGLDDMTENLRRMFESISYTSETLNNSSSELANISAQMSSGTGYLTGHSNTIAAAAEELNVKRINQLGKITETITEIAEQTNLLTLNATIEAARAGEAWKGFEVIANEIKEMAKQTAEAPMEIWEKIKFIQGSTKETVSKIEQISKVINQVKDIVETINVSVEEQSSTSNEVAENVAQASIGIRKVTENLA